MAKYEDPNQLDYRNGGDTVDDFAQKYMRTIAYVFKALNDLRTPTGNTAGVEPEPYMWRIADNKLYIRNADNTDYILLGDISPNFGFRQSVNDQFITTADLEREGTVVVRDANNKVTGDITGSPDKIADKPVDVTPTSTNDILAYDATQQAWIKKTLNDYLKKTDDPDYDDLVAEIVDQVITDITPVIFNYWRPDAGGYLTPLGNNIIAPQYGSTDSSVGAADRKWKEGHFEKLPNWQEYLAESTGFGIISGCEPTISGLTVTVGAGIVHLADGTRKEISSTTVTLDAADSTNPRIDLVYINSTGAVAKITGTAVASPVVPSVPTGGISICNVSVAAGATTGTVTGKRGMLPRFYNTGIVSVKDFGAVGDGVHDDTAAIQAAVNNGGAIYIPDGKYKVTHILITDKPVILYGNGKDISIIQCGQIEAKAQSDFYNIGFLGDTSYLYPNYADIYGDTDLDSMAVFLVGEQTQATQSEVVSDRYAGANFVDCDIRYDSSAFDSNGKFKYNAHAIKAHSVEGVTISRCKIYAGVEFRYTTDFLVTDSHFDMLGVPIDKSNEPIHATIDCSGTIRGNTFTGCRTDDIDLYPSSHDINIVGNKFVQNYHSHTLTIKTHMRDTDYASATNFRDFGIHNVLITDNFFIDEVNQGVMLDLNCYDERAVNTDDVTSFLPRNVKITNNIFASKGENAVRCMAMSGGQRNFEFSNNKIYGPQSQIVHDFYGAEGYEDLFKSRFYSQDMVIKNNYVDSKQGCSWYMFNLVYVNNLVLKDNIIDFGAYKANITNELFKIDHVTGKLITDNKILGTLPQNKSAYTITNTVNKIIEMNDEVHQMSPTIEQSRATNLSGGFYLKDGRVILDCNFTAAITIPAGSTPLTILNIGNVFAERNYPVIGCYNETQKKNSTGYVYNGGVSAVLQMNDITAGDVIHVSGEFTYNSLKI